MAHVKILADKVRKALESIPDVKEQKMFRELHLWSMKKCALYK